MIITDIGATKIAVAAGGGAAVDFSEMAFGDNGDAVSSDLTALRNERARVSINQVSQSADQVTVEAILPATTGGFYVKEIGLFDSFGDMLAIGTVEGGYKPVLVQGSVRELVVRVNIVVGESASVTLTVDPSLVTATQDYVNDAIDAHEAAAGTVHTAAQATFNNTSAQLDGDPATVQAAIEAAALAGGGGGGNFYYDTLNGITTGLTTVGGNPALNVKTYSGSADQRDAFALDIDADLLAMVEGKVLTLDLLCGIGAVVSTGDVGLELNARTNDPGGSTATITKSVVFDASGWTENALTWRQPGITFTAAELSGVWRIDGELTRDTTVADNTDAAFLVLRDRWAIEDAE